MFEINLRGKVAMVTGVSSGIGFGIAKMLAKAGCAIVGCALEAKDSLEVQGFLSAVKEEGVPVYYHRADLSSISEMQVFVKAALAQFNGKLDILVSNAGKNFFEGAIDCGESEWQQNIDLNLSSHWRLAKLCKPYLELNNGVIIIMTSNHASATIPGCFPYNVAKTALTGLVNSLAIEWGPSIRTIGIAPGFIDTQGNQNWFDSFDDPEKEKQRTIAMHPVKRLGTTEEIGGWCVFLASEYAAFATGTTYLIDGGRSALMQDS